MLTVSLTDAEKDRFKRHASIYGLGLTDYVRLLDSRSDICAFSDKELDHLRAKQPHWVSVKDRLPNIDQPVLAYSGEELGIGFAYLDRDGKWYGNCGDVTHWMPLPEPPEVDDATD